VPKITGSTPTTAAERCKVRFWVDFAREDGSCWARGTDYPGSPNRQSPPRKKLTMNRAFSSSTAVAVLLTVMTACGGSPTGTNSGDPLTAEEITQLLSVLSESFGGIGAVPTFSHTGTSVDQPMVHFQSVPVNADFNESVSCPGGGSLGLQGSMDGDVDDQTFVGSINLKFKWSINACVVNTETTTFTVNSDPDIEFDGSYVFTETSFSVSGSEKGGFSFSALDGRSGSCAIDLSFETSFTQGGSASGSFSGSVCGVDANQFN